MSKAYWYYAPEGCDCCGGGIWMLRAKHPMGNNGRPRNRCDNCRRSCHPSAKRPCHLSRTSLAVEP